MYNSVILPVLGFLFLPLTLIVYTYLQKTTPGQVGVQQIVFLLIAAVLDLGLVGGGTFKGRRH